MQEIAVNKIVALLLAQQKGEITVQEQEKLDEWFNASEGNCQFIERCLDEVQVAASLQQIEEIDDVVAWEQFMKKNEPVQTPSVPFLRKSWRWIAAAIIIGISLTGVYFLINSNNQNTEQEIVTNHKSENILPGTNQATLTLGDGRRIALHSTRDGFLAKEGETVVNKQGDELIYNSEKHVGSIDKNKAVLYHIVNTPRGGNYALTLPDKTKVWLNAEASIRYPTVFTGKERKVEITGEVYFEVEKKANQSFLVTINNIQVKVLGTHFNIRGYIDEETTKTTLLEGSIEVTTLDRGGKTILKPSQQAVVLSDQAQKSSAILVQVVDVEGVIAWKSGYFDFKARPLNDIMQEIKRWYADVEKIDIKEPLTDRLTATIPRNVPLNTMLNILEATGKVRFHVKDKTITVTR